MTVNGRELHRLDVAALQRCLAVVPGRYWVLANGTSVRHSSSSRFVSRMSGRRFEAANSTTKSSYRHRHDQRGRREGRGVYRRQGHHDPELILDIY